MVERPWSELDAFGAQPAAGLLRGGLPPALLRDDLDPSFYEEWLDSYFARDVQELFRIEKRAGFLKLLQPRVYGFDTGFVCHVRGWDSLRAEDHGSL
ncbi:MAG: hypothetical protein JNK82_05405 [Myxococcaceae bacterium]|nr:hypothetical protein [Myxococcaceae bacterium]